MNIKFEYLYRDAGNYKNWGEVFFFNPNNLTVELITSMAEKALIDKSFFVADSMSIPDLHFEEYNPQLDHDWHEFHAFTSTEEAPNDLLNRNIEDFIKSLQSAYHAQFSN
jgi:hypothetical protein